MTGLIILLIVMFISIVVQALWEPVTTYMTNKKIRSAPGYVAPVKKDLRKGDRRINKNNERRIIK